MSFEDKVKEGLGKAKEEFGKLTDNEKLENEGKAEQLKGKAGQAVDDAKDKAGELKDAAEAKIYDATHKPDQVREDTAVRDATYDDTDPGVTENRTAQDMWPR